MLDQNEPKSQGSQTGRMEEMTKFLFPTHEIMRTATLFRTHMFCLWESSLSFAIPPEEILNVISSKASFKNKAYIEIGLLKI